ncbi:LamG-like jellyroll fold domain-containing protein [Nonlabens sp.]|uniref:LamG-like jellyroll fold domain-containing protein n=1 Tax=Nonlabens sp. TaxID=1888209 RepID=UPI003F696EB0
MKKTLLLLTFLSMSATLFAQTQNSLTLDGSNDYVQTSYTGVLGTANRSFEAWIKLDPSAPNSNLAIVDYGVNAVGSRNTFLVNSSRGLSYISGGTNANINSNAGIIPVDQWVHVAFVLDNATGFLYLNGAQVGTGNLSTVNTPSGGTTLRIGERVPGGSIFFPGAIDEVRIWGRALTASDLSTGSSSEICPSSTDLLAYYQFNEGAASSNNSGINTLPELVNGNDGTLNGFSLSGASSNWTAGSPVSQFLTTDVSLNAGVLTAAQTGATYQWIDCDTDMPVSGATAMTFTPTTIGNYAVDITELGCTQRSECITVTTLGMETNTLNNIKLNANPSTTLHFTGTLSSDAQVSIYSLSGKELLKGAINDYQILEPSIASGLYMVILSQNGSSKTFKWVKE